MLSPPQSVALRHVEAAADEREAAALSSIAAIFKRAGCGFDLYSEAIDWIRRYARIVVHFHPDRFGHKVGANVAERLLNDGVYRNQFETSLSSASPTAYPGGERDAWEHTLFGGAYHCEGVAASERPKYGSLELVRFPDGPAPRFGSCYFVLRDVGARTSITFMGSEHPQAGERLGTLAKPHSAMAALLSEIENGGMAAPDWPPFLAPTLGVPGITICRFCHLAKRLREHRPNPAVGEPGRVLDTGIEAQIHGDILLHRDVETLVADPAFAAMPVGRTLQALAGNYGFGFEWHCGFKLSVPDVPDDFRGQVMPAFAQHVAGGSGFLDAALIGRAAASLHHNPELWRDWGDYWEVLRLLRQLWHVVVHFGVPNRNLSSRP